MAESGYLTPAAIRELAERLDLRPTKKLGQNFVTDANTVRRIVRDAQINPRDRVLEVGPGLGSLTLGLVSTGAEVTAVEIDSRLASQLPLTVAALAPDARLTVIEADALEIESLPSPPTHLVANLPYNVSVPVILHLLAIFPSISRALVMVQSEVGKRITAPPGSRVYGVPSAKAAWYGDWREAGSISRQVFWPIPNVDSILTGFERRAEPLGSEKERIATFRLIDAAFAQRRKMLRQALAETLGESAQSRFEAAGIDPTLRGEQLDIRQFLELARNG
ncbi:MAG: 16S rRNA (adenine(1518)-N(6)/adenine(1519)-N(6))-dimethyltransferase RsmA [Cryobacterium sp.]|nr:16S rRNA (adenine(1518)-N(6)/adenine(1519)-N(6))-dimethyltransferase RsmA [Cryobacterium sp.]MBX3090096.1 16S rRNA (adenine(1518)-N(6)/adenine(1519)-N(6))-dimethyltransferase RsmA [Cryobacterium sp.]MBX3116793.1 16S rRNA (adenine(1518)-N(6)/adenine(1519)-N(6))-dimethyltransferase RsmA [Cryobacterium sp.]